MSPERLAQILAAIEAARPGIAANVGVIDPPR